MKFVKIKSMSAHTERCYDLTVENNHNFFCNDVLIHNCDYRGEVKVILANMGKSDFCVKKGDRVAQLVFAPVSSIIFQNILPEDFETTARGSGGFGSTGLA